MIKAEVIFKDDHITINDKDVWFHCESAYFAVGKFDEDYEDSGEIEDLFPSQELAVAYCLEQKPKNKYDWSNVPKEVKWIATDSDGEVWGFQCRPHTLENYMWTGFMPIGLGTIGATGYWQESLEQRPEEQSQ